MISLVFKMDIKTNFSSLYMTNLPLLKLGPKYFTVLMSIIFSCHLFCFVSCTHQKPVDYFKDFGIKPDDEHLLEKCGIPTEEKIINRNKEIDLAKSKLQTRSPQTFGGKWTVEGPANLGAMVTCLAIDPKNESVVYAGYSEGGLFKSSDGMKTWQAIFDKELTLSIGCIAIDPANSNIVYVGTGDPNNGAYITAGNGIYKSTDGGKNWKNIGLSECRNIAKMIIDENDPSIIFAAALGNPFEFNPHRGIYKSSDGGLTWEKKLFRSDSVGFLDIVVAPGNPNILYASSYDRYLTASRFAYGGSNTAVYQSKDKGNTWKKMNAALPSGKWGRINLAVCASSPGSIAFSYIKFDSINPPGTYDLGGIRLSNDLGVTWQDIGIPEDRLKVLAGFGWYFGNLVINPKNIYDMYILGVDLWRTVDQGASWSMAAPPWHTYEVHADKHALVFRKDGSFLLGTDGGIYLYSPVSNTWTDVDNIPAAQIYRVKYSRNYPDDYIAGAQDNGTSGGNASTINDWVRIYGGDGFQFESDETNIDLTFAEYQNGNIVNVVTFENIGQGMPGTANWDTPYFLYEGVMYSGTQFFLENKSITGVGWIQLSDDLTLNGRYPTRRTPNITSIHQNLNQSQGRVIIGTSNGLVWLSDPKKELGENWLNISSGLPPGYVSSVKLSASSTEKCFVTLSTKQQNNYTSHVYASYDAGQHWKDIHGNLPNVPVYDIFVYPGRSDSLLFVGTDIGVYATITAGATWERLGDDMPFIPVLDIDLDSDKNRSIAGTFARGVQTFSLTELVKKYAVGTEETVHSTPIEWISTLVDSELKINFSSEGEHTLKIIDAGGRIISQKIVQGKIVNWNISELEFGVYFLQMQNAAIKKFAKI